MGVERPGVHGPGEAFGASACLGSVGRVGQKRRDRLGDRDWSGLDDQAGGRAIHHLARTADISDRDRRSAGERFDQDIGEPLRRRRVDEHIGRGEQGVLMAEPYKSEILPHWKFRTPALASDSAARIFGMFRRYLSAGDFVGADMARKFLQMGFTRARRYANHTAGRKYGSDGSVLPQLDDWQSSEKAQSARIFYEYYSRAKGDATYLRMIRDTAALRAQGWNAAAVKAEILARWANKTYRPPAKPGLSYMAAPIMRTSGPPDMKVHTMAMPHLMFYAPYASNADIGAKPDLANHARLMWPFVDKQGLPEHTYFIHMIGAAEKARILSDEKPLLDALCAYHDVLCLTSHH